MLLRFLRLLGLQLGESPLDSLLVRYFVSTLLDGGGRHHQLLLLRAQRVVLLWLCSKREICSGPLLRLKSLGDLVGGSKSKQEQDDNINCSSTESHDWRYFQSNYNNYNDSISVI